MKRAILAILFATSLQAADMEVALDAPVAITETVVSQVQASAVKVKHITIDGANQQIEIEFIGIEKRLVRKMTNTQWNNFRTSFVTSYGTTLKAMIVEHFTPPPPETP